MSVITQHFRVWGRTIAESFRLYSKTPLLGKKIINILLKLHVEQREVLGASLLRGPGRKLMGFVMLGGGIRVLKTEAPFYYFCKCETWCTVSSFLNSCWKVNRSRRIAEQLCWMFYPPSKKKATHYYSLVCLQLEKQRSTQSIILQIREWPPQEKGTKD